MSNTSTSTVRQCDTYLAVESWEVDRVGCENKGIGPVMEGDIAKDEEQSNGEG
jgi:hypothetical protein